MKILYVSQVTDLKDVDRLLQIRTYLTKIFQTQCECLVICEKEAKSDAALQTVGGRVFQLSTIGFSVTAPAKEIIRFIKKNNYSGVIISNTVGMTKVAVEIAMDMKAKLITNITELSVQEGEVYAFRQNYGNLISAKYLIPQNFVFTEALILKDMEKDSVPETELHNLNSSEGESRIRLLSRKQCRTENTQSTVAVVAGRGVASRADLDSIRRISKENGWFFGVSRPVAMCGWADIDELVGVSGMKLSSRIVVTIGVSGSAAFMVGIENCHYILSVNINSDAPIYDKSDAIIIDDYRNVLKPLMRKLASNI